MRKDWKYIAYLVVLGALVLAVMLFKTKQYDWQITLSHLDKNPYGTYALNELLQDFFNRKKIKNSYKTFYELKDSVHDENILIISSGFNPDKEDTKALLSHVEKGATLFISANFFYGAFADTLGLGTRDSFFQGEGRFDREDSASLHFVSPVLDSTRQFYYKKSNIYNYFSNIDSVSATVIAKNDYYQPVTVRIARGKGAILLNCTPIAFTNIYLLSNQNHDFISHSLSYLPPRETYWTEFYHLGRMESSSPLRFILTTEPLRWAYYITLGSILFFMIFEAKRKQRIIPVITPLANTTLEFVGTVGNLYFQKGDHKNIAEKKIQFFFEYIRSNYYITTRQLNEEFVSVLSKKTGAPEQTVRQLKDLINLVHDKEKISSQELIRLNSLLEKIQSKAH